jgi:superfamily I DNA/RNA helicase
MERLDEIFEPAAFDSLTAAWDGSYRELLTWWQTRVSLDLADRVKYPADIAAKRGPQGLLDTPRVVVGTIHSVKGGQADVVYLFPDLSQAADAQYGRGGAMRDSVVRLFYVGATRAYEQLHVCQRETGMAITL